MADNLADMLRAALHAARGAEASTYTEARVSMSSREVNVDIAANSLFCDSPIPYNAADN